MAKKDIISTVNPKLFLKRINSPSIMDPKDLVKLDPVKPQKVKITKGPKWKFEQDLPILDKQASRLPNFPKNYHKWSASRQQAWLNGDTYKLKQLSRSKKSSSTKQQLSKKEEERLLKEEERLLKEHLDHPDTKHFLSWHEEDMKKLGDLSPVKVTNPPLTRRDRYILKEIHKIKEPTSPKDDAIKAISSLTKV